MGLPIGILKSPVAANSDPGNNAAGFNGTTQYLSRVDNPGLQITGAFSVGAWVRISTSTLNRSIISQWETPSQLGFILFTTGSGTISLGVSNDGSAQTYVNGSTFGALSVDTWYFVQGWYTGAALSVSVNNGSTDTVVYSSGVHNSTADLRLSTWNNSGTPNFYMEGRIDSAYFAKSDIGSTVRTSLYNAGVGKKWSQLFGIEQPLFTGWWDLKETGTNNRLDATINGNDLTPIVSMPNAAGITV